MNLVTLHNCRSFTYFCFIAIFVITLVALVPSGSTKFSPLSSQRRQTPGFCESAPSGNAVYVSRIYDTKLNLPIQFAGNVISAEFIEYLKGRYNFKTTSSYAASCPIYTNMAEAEARMRFVETQARQANKQFVQVEWTYVVDEDLVAASYSFQGENIEAVVAGHRKSTHVYCASESAQGTLYTAGPVERGSNELNLSNWNRGFAQLLQQKYSATENVSCSLTSLPVINRWLAARVAGARAAGKKIVDTGWKYDPNAVATNNLKPAQRDDDAEPAQRPAPPNPSRQASDQAMKEVPESVAYCKKDPAMSAIFNCDQFGREVYDYRMQHLADKPETLASLLATNKWNCTSCVDPVRVSEWISKKGSTDQLDNRTINCVTQNVIVALQSKAEPNRLKELYNEAVGKCRK